MLHVSFVRAYTHTH